MWERTKKGQWYQAQRMSQRPTPQEMELNRKSKFGFRGMLRVGVDTVFKTQWEEMKSFQ